MKNIVEIQIGDILVYHHLNHRLPLILDKCSKKEVDNYISDKSLYLYNNTFYGNTRSFDDKSILDIISIPKKSKRECIMKNGDNYYSITDEKLQYLIEIGVFNIDMKNRRLNNINKLINS